MNEQCNNEIGVVIIGRNEGERLRRSIESVLDQTNKIVYVDSDSSDGSVEYAKSKGVEVVCLNPDEPMNMAKGRNAGFKHLIELHPKIQFIQFIDGDCELLPGWIQEGVSYLKKHKNVAIVSGRRRERFVDASVYNKLADIEWDSEIGVVKYCHGDAMIRAEVLTQTGGFNTTMICGEEPELCIRIRQNGWEIHRIDCEMTMHDADIHKFKQWWLRTIRSGWGFAEGATMHGKAPERHWKKESHNIWFYGLILPFFIITLFPWGLLLLSVYAWHFIKLFRYGKQKKWPSRTSRLFALFMTLSKFPAVYGQMKFHINRVTASTANLIEYKESK
ncbi:glycosyltransferase [Planctomycetota bacterium]|nr:glycosyltransferase [Planctomycetota bacterium]